MITSADWSDSTPLPDRLEARYSGHISGVWMALIRGVRSPLAVAGRRIHKAIRCWCPPLPYRPERPRLLPADAAPPCCPGHVPGFLLREAPTQVPALLAALEIEDSDNESVCIFDG